MIPEHIEQYSLPTAPPKATDQRAFVGQTVQAEALPPDVLARIVERAIEQNIDLDAYHSMIKFFVLKKDDRRG
ncbi:MAG: hypothetical protein WA970_24350 [Gammaproteobacteria bacterium]